MDNTVRDQRGNVKIDLSDSHPHEGFRSNLEVQIAAELDRLGVHHAYEQPWVRPEDGYSPHYLPDFTIEPSDTADELLLPRWVEVKPQQFIYDMFEALGLARKLGERFSTDAIITGLDSQAMKARHIAELWKPKYLAELSGQNVLVVGAVGATSRLTVEMRRSEIVFSRSHPFVNQHGIEKERAREQRREEQEEERRAWEQRRDEMLAQQRRQNAQRQQVSYEVVRKVIGHRSHGTPRFLSPCVGCGNRVQHNATLYRVLMSSGREEWKVVCLGCHTRATS